MTAFGLAAPFKFLGFRVCADWMAEQQAEISKLQREGLSLFRIMFVPLRLPSGQWCANLV